MLLEEVSLREPVCDGLPDELRVTVSLAVFDWDDVLDTDGVLEELAVGDKLRDCVELGELDMLDVPV